MTITSLDGYRWLKNDIIRGNFQPDEITNEFADIALCTWRWAVTGSSFATGGGTAGHGGESKRVSGGVYVRAGAARYFRRPRQYGSDVSESGDCPRWR